MYCGPSPAGSLPKIHSQDLFSCVPAFAAYPALIMGCACKFTASLTFASGACLAAFLLLATRCFDFTNTSSDGIIVWLDRPWDVVGEGFSDLFSRTAILVLHLARLRTENVHQVRLVANFWSDYVAPSCIHPLKGHKSQPCIAMYAK
jgi:hypothetical protein